LKRMRKAQASLRLGSLADRDAPTRRTSDKIVRQRRERPVQPKGT
jgi:hypothetical protein